MEKVNEKTVWTKNLDSRYISGEDLKFGVEKGKGLKQEMVVEIVKFEDAETFDSNSQSKVTKSGLFLKDVESNKMLYKPVILNKTNGEFLSKEFNSMFLDDWIGKPFVLYAQPHKRFGFVARFKKYFPKSTVSPVKAVSKLKKSKTLVELKSNWESLSSDEQKHPTVLAEKDKLKVSLNK